MSNNPNEKENIEELKNVIIEVYALSDLRHNKSKMQQVAFRALHENRQLYCEDTWLKGEPDDRNYELMQEFKELFVFYIWLGVILHDGHIV